MSNINPSAVRIFVPLASMVHSVSRDALDVNEMNNLSLFNIVHFINIKSINPSAVRIFVPLASMVHSVSRDALAKMEECVITSLENALALLAGW